MQILDDIPFNNSWPVYYIFVFNSLIVSMLCFTDLTYCTFGIKILFYIYYPNKVHVCQAGESDSRY